MDEELMRKAENEMQENSAVSQVAGHGASQSTKQVDDNALPPAGHIQAARDVLARLFAILDDKFRMWDVYKTAMNEWCFSGTFSDGDGKFSCTRESVIDALVDAIEFTPLPTVPRRPRLLGMSGFAPYKSGSKWRLKYLGQDYGISVDRKSDAESFARRQAEASENAICEWDRKYAWCAGKVEGKDFRYRD
jgi:hypothetical protein